MSLHIIIMFLAGYGLLHCGAGCLNADGDSVHIEDVAEDAVVEIEGLKELGGGFPSTDCCPGSHWQSSGGHGP